MRKTIANLFCTAMRVFRRGGMVPILVFIGGLGETPLAMSHATPANQVCQVKNYGAQGNGITLDTRAINLAISDCAARGGGKVEVGPGVYPSGTIYFKDNVTLDLQKGATILASADLADYPPMAQASEWRNTSLLIAENVSNIAITGEGTIDGNGRAFISKNQIAWKPSFDVNLLRQGQAYADRMALSREGPLTMGNRPGVLFVALHVNGLQIKDVHIVDAPNWTIKIGCSSHIKVAGLDVRNNLLIPNNDGLEISSSSDATVENSYLSAGDDALVIGGPCLDGWCQAPAEHIRVKNVTLTSRSAAIRIGPSAKGVRDVKISRVQINDSNRGILLMTRSNESIENISVSDSRINTRLIDGPWWGAGEPIAISVAQSDYVSWPKVNELGHISHVHFSHITTSSDSPLIIYASQPGHIDDITFSGLKVNIHADDLDTALGGNLDLQPINPSQGAGIRKQDFAAIFLHNVDSVSFDRVQVKWQGVFPAYYTNALAADNFEYLSIKHFDGHAAQPGLPDISLDRMGGATISKSKVTTSITSSPGPVQ